MQKVVLPRAKLILKITVQYRFKILNMQYLQKMRPLQDKCIKHFFNDFYIIFKIVSQCDYKSHGCLAYLCKIEQYFVFSECTIKIV